MIIDLTTDPTNRWSSARI